MSKEPQSARETSPDDLVSLKPIIIQTVMVTLVLLGLIVILATLFANPTREFAVWIVEEVGYGGIFLGVVASDAFTMPIPPDTYLLVAVASDQPVVPILTTIIAGSLLAGVMGYKLGPTLNKIPFLRRRIDDFRPRGEALYRRYGVWTVVIAALTPIPFSIICWFAGIYHMPFRRFLPATLARIPRFVAYYYVFVLGWSPVG